MNKYFLLIFAAVTVIIIFTQISPNSTGDCSDPQIKGNGTTYNGEKIYHMPDGQFYDVTDAEEMFCTTEDAEEMFCTTEDAEAAGYRMSER